MRRAPRCGTSTAGCIGSPTKCRMQRPEAVACPGGPRAYSSSSPLQALGPPVFHHPASVRYLPVGTQTSDLRVMILRKAGRADHDLSHAMLPLPEGNAFCSPESDEQHVRPTRSLWDNPWTGSNAGAPGGFDCGMVLEQFAITDTRSMLIASHNLLLARYLSERTMVAHPAGETIPGASCQIIGDLPTGLVRTPQAAWETMASAKREGAHAEGKRTHLADPSAPHGATPGSEATRERPGTPWCLDRGMVSVGPERQRCMVLCVHRGKFFSRLALEPLTARATSGIVRSRQELRPTVLACPSERHRRIEM